MTNRILRALIGALAVLLMSVAVAVAAAVYTFATLPGSPSAGDLAWITDGNGTESVGSPAAGGGANMHLVAWDAGQARWEFVMEGAPTTPPTADAATYLEGVQVSYDATISGLSAANVQAAIDELAATGAGAAHIVSDEGTPLTQRPEIDFTGSGITCSDDAGGNATSCLVLAPIWTVVAALPGSPSNTEQTYVVIDGAALDDCDTGSGSLNVHCSWDGAAWQALGGGGGGGGAPTDAAYIVDVANGTLSAEVVVNNLATLNAWLGTSIADGAHTAAGAPTTATYWTTSANGSLSAEVVVSNITQLNSALGSTIADGPHTTSASLLTTGTLPAARLGADSIGEITDIASSIKSGADGTLVTGTIATTDKLMKVDANNDAVESDCSETAGALTCSGSGTFSQVTVDDVDGENALTLFDNPSGDVDAPTGDNVALFTKDDQFLYIKRAGDGALISDRVATGYSAAVPRFAGSNLAAGALIPVTTSAGTVFGNCVEIDNAGDQVNLLCPGDYKVTTSMLPGFTFASDECMRIVARTTTPVAASPEIFNIHGSGGHGAGLPERGGTTIGVAFFSVATTDSIEWITAACDSGTYPTTNTFDGDSSRALVERVQ